MKIRKQTKTTTKILNPTMCQKQHQKSKNKAENRTEKVLAFMALIVREYYIPKDAE